MAQPLTALFPLLYLLTYASENTDLSRRGSANSNSVQRQIFDKQPDYAMIWSVPFQSCVKAGATTPQALRNAGVLVNKGNSFQGDRITTFYTLGLYPYIGHHGDVNGGIPQLADLKSHLLQSKKDIENALTDTNYTGLALIDWEAWRPVWEFNFGTLTVYQKRSVELVREQHPEWPPPAILAEATYQWEVAARNFMESTLRLAKDLRPKAQWCFYGFPDCYNYHGKQRPETFFCAGSIMQGNDKLQWLWDLSSALCPSIYARKAQFMQYNLTERSWYTFGRLQEAFRVGGYAKPIYPYINYFIFDAAKTVPSVDFARLLTQPKSLGMAGVVIWGSSKNIQTKADCEVMDKYVRKVIVPSMLVLRNQSDSCVQQFCQGNDMRAILQCTWTKPIAYEAWKMLASEESIFDTRGLICTGPPISSKGGHY